MSKLIRRGSRCSPASCRRISRFRLVCCFLAQNGVQALGVGSPDGSPAAQPGQVEVSGRRELDGGAGQRASQRVSASFLLVKMIIILYIAIIIAIIIQLY